MAYDQNRSILPSINVNQVAQEVASRKERTTSSRHYQELYTDHEID
jgi:hypothetical protein